MRLSKNLFLACLLILISGIMAANAQTANNISVVKIKDCYMKKDGKMVQYTNGVPMKLKKSVLLENGTKVKCNGVLVMPDKSRVRMQEGNCIDRKGKLGDCAVRENPTTSL